MKYIKNNRRFFLNKFTQCLSKRDRFYVEREKQKIRRHECCWLCGHRIRRCWTTRTYIEKSSSKKLYWGERQTDNDEYTYMYRERIKLSVDRRTVAVGCKRCIKISKVKNLMGRRSKREKERERKQVNRLFIKVNWVGRDGGNIDAYPIWVNRVCA